MLFSGLTVMISLSAVLLVPIPAFRSMAAGMMLAVGFVLLAAMTLLPALLGPWINRFALPWHTAGRAPQPVLGAVRSSGVQKRAASSRRGTTALLLLLASPLLNLETGMPEFQRAGRTTGRRAHGYEAARSRVRTGRSRTSPDRRPRRASDADAVARHCRQRRRASWRCSRPSRGRRRQPDHGDRDDRSIDARQSSALIADAARDTACRGCS